MSRFFQPRDLIIALLAAGLALALAALWMRPAPVTPVAAPATTPTAPTPRATPDLGGLEQSLEKAAQTALPDQSLSNEQITVKAGDQTPGDRAHQIADLANKIGGTGIVTITNGRTGLLARVPAAQAADFYHQITGNPLPAASAASGGDQWFDITVEK
ncbi:MAG: hypothetical protein QM796_13695 [Chthoniobacteraceae bacterium]